MNRKIVPVIVLVSSAGLFSLISIVINPTVVISRAWFVYQKGDPLNPQSYTRAIGSPECHGSGRLCAVYAEVSADNQYQPGFKSLEELAAQSSNFSREVPGLVSHRDANEPPGPTISGHFP